MMMDMNNLKNNILKKILVVGTVAYDEIETPSESSGKILGGAGTYIG